MSSNLTSGTIFGRFEKKFPAITQTTAAYKRLRIPEKAIARRLQVHTAAYSGAFDLGVHNGTMVQLVKCWSFQLPGQDELAEEVKAWAWLVERLRDEGGEGVSKTSTYPIDRAADVSVVFVPPVADVPAPALEEAKAAFATLEIRAVDAGNAEFVAAEAGRRLGIASQSMNLR